MERETDMKTAALAVADEIQKRYKTKLHCSREVRRKLLHPTTRESDYMYLYAMDSSGIAIF